MNKYRKKKKEKARMTLAADYICPRFLIFLQKETWEDVIYLTQRPGAGRAVRAEVGVADALSDTMICNLVF